MKRGLVQEGRAVGMGLQARSCESSIEMELVLLRELTRTEPGGHRQRATRRTSQPGWNLAFDHLPSKAGVQRIFPVFQKLRYLLDFPKITGDGLSLKDKYFLPWTCLVAQW